MGEPTVDVGPVSPAGKLGIVEILDRDGHARATIPIWRWPVTIGRAIDCDVVLDDVHAAPRHATLSEVDGALTLIVGTTVNGAETERRRLAADQSATLEPEEIIQVGTTRLRVRRATDAIAPERLLLPESESLRAQIVVMALVFMGWNAARYWLQTDPGGRLSDYVTVVLGSVVPLLLWAGFWSVGSKLVQHRFDYQRHSWIAFAYSLIISGLAAALPVVAYSFGWALPSRVAWLASGAVVSAMVLAHLTLILPNSRTVLAGIVGVLFLAGAGLFTARNYQIYERPFTELYVSTLAPPSLRLAHGVSPSQFIDASRSLKGRLDAHVNDGQSDSGGEESGP
jgi:hypothetical protein